MSRNVCIKIKIIITPHNESLGCLWYRVRYLKEAFYSGFKNFASLSRDLPRPIVI